jgi:tRNA (guanine37-N1)-methyltransferase
MKIDIITTFVEMFSGPFHESIIKRAQEFGKVEINIHNLRQWTHDSHHKTDDEQYGGGDGMVMLAEPIIEAVESIQNNTDCPSHFIVTTPQGREFTQPIAEELSQKDHIIILCGHYKGIDERVMEYFQPDEISIGDYILTGGELPAMIITDAIVRLIPGVVGSYSSVEEDSFSSGLLDCPRYTRPRETHGLQVPDVLLSGNHKHIQEWRLQQALERTAKRRPDILDQYKNKSKNDGSKGNE